MNTDDEEILAALGIPIGTERGGELEAAFSSVDVPGGQGRFGLWTRSGGAVLKARRGDFAISLREGGAALR